MALEELWNRIMDLWLWGPWELAMSGCWRLRRVSNLGGSVVS